MDLEFHRYVRPTEKPQLTEPAMEFQWLVGASHRAWLLDPVDFGQVCLHYKRMLVGHRDKSGLNGVHGH